MDYTSYAIECQNSCPYNMENFGFMILHMHLKYSFFFEGSEQASVYLNSLLELIIPLKPE